MLKYKTVKIIYSTDLDKLVEETYKKSYCFQQQDGCRERGEQFWIKIPSVESYDEFYPDKLYKFTDNFSFGVKFETWLNTNPSNSIDGISETSKIKTHWKRHFYPDYHILLNDLHEKDLIEKGEYIIQVDL